MILSCIARCVGHQCDASVKDRERLSDRTAVSQALRHRGRRPGSMHGAIVLAIGPAGRGPLAAATDSERPRERRRGRAAGQALAWPFPAMEYLLPSDLGNVSDCAPGGRRGVSVAVERPSVCGARWHPVGTMPRRPNAERKQTDFRGSGWRSSRCTPSLSRCGHRGRFWWGGTGAGARGYRCWRGCVWRPSLCGRKTDERLFWRPCGGPCASGGTGRTSFRHWSCRYALSPAWARKISMSP